MSHQPSYSDSLYTDYIPSYSDSLMHYGILGMKWGVRRFEDKNGHLTPAGKKRYDKYDYSTKTASIGKKSLSKKGMSLGKKAALVGGIALGAYGTSQILKNKKELSDIRNHIESTHSNELEGLDSKRREKILNRVSKEQKYEQNRIEKLKKSKDPRDQKKAETGSRLLTDDHISYRINKLKPRKLRSTNLKKAKKLNENKTNSINKNSPKKQPGKMSDSTIEILNANRIASINRSRNLSRNSSMQSQTEPAAKVTRVETKTTAPKERTKKDKSSKKSEKKMPISTKVAIGKGVYDNLKAIHQRDYAQVIQNGNQALIDSTNKLIQQLKDQRI